MEELLGSCCDIASGSLLEGLCEAASADGSSGSSNDSGSGSGSCGGERPPRDEPDPPQPRGDKKGSSRLSARDLRDIPLR